MNWNRGLLARVQSRRLRLAVDATVRARAPQGAIESELVERFVREALEKLVVKVDPADVEVSASEDDRQFQVVLDVRWQPVEIRAEVVGGPLDGTVYVLNEELPALRLPVPESPFVSPDDRRAPTLASKALSLPLVGWSETHRTYLYAWESA